MDTSSLNRSDLLPVATVPVATVLAPAPGNIADTHTANSIVAAKQDTAARLPSKTELKKSVDAINRFLKNNREVEFSIDDASGLSVVKVIDTETRKVIRQLPSEQSLEISKNLHSLKGLLIDSKA
jgi:flagellar protein FlaG